MSIISKPSSPEYIKNYSNIFKKKEKVLCKTCRSINCDSNPCKVLEEYKKLTKEE
jgi:hypothetical protein